MAPKPRTAAPMTTLAANAARLESWRSRPLPDGLRGFVRWARELNDWTQEDLATVSGLSHRAVRALETGQRRPSLDTARKLAAAIGCSVEDLPTD